jgi:hypothetical protein
MVPITDRAMAYIQSLPFRNEGMVCVVRVWWDRGDSDNKRSASGDVMWEHSGPRGWTVDVGGYPANEVPEQAPAPIVPEIYVELDARGRAFPGGVIDFKDGHLFLRENAV